MSMPLLLGVNKMRNFNFNNFNQGLRFIFRFIHITSGPHEIVVDLYTSY